jgi:guanylate kinase
MPGTLFIVTAPSGAGKTTLVSGLLARDPLVKLSVSYATREPRAGEVDGTHYHFVDVPTFRALRDKGEFLEWAEVHSNYYGTSRAWLEAQIAGGNDILLEIDWQGAQQVRKVFPKAVGCSSCPRRWRSWSDACAAAAPTPRMSLHAGCLAPGARCAMWPSSTTL